MFHASVIFQATRPAQGLGDSAKGTEFPNALNQVILEDGDDSETLETFPFWHLCILKFLCNRLDLLDWPLVTQCAQLIFRSPIN